jgi:hypothetical protein
LWLRTRPLARYSTWGSLKQRPATFTGLFETDVIPPRDEAQVFRNPLGIYVVSFNWSKEFTESIVTAPATVDPTNNPAREETSNESSE